MPGSCHTHSPAPRGLAPLNLLFLRKALSHQLCMAVTERPWDSLTFLKVKVKGQGTKGHRGADRPPWLSSACVSHLSPEVQKLPCFRREADTNSRAFPARTAATRRPGQFPELPSLTPYETREIKVHREGKS